ncbi:hypothetical protein MBLNU230_g7159t1 [Neophaeotheca triangularis]
MAANSLLDSLKSASLLPSTVIPAGFTPTYELAVSFPAISPSHGSLVRKSQASEAPQVTFSSTSSTTDSSDSLTFVLIDPDAPTPDDPKFAYWRHWVVANIPSSAGNVPAGKTLTGYLAPGPKDESGPHRYLFLLFKEPQGLKLDKSDVGGEEFVERRSFKADEFGPAFPPQQNFDHSSSTSGMDIMFEPGLLDLYYEFFHAAHPCALPRPFLMHRLLDDDLQLLVKVIHYIGSLFAPVARSEGRSGPIESAVSDFRCGISVPNGFDVQAVLLYSIAVYWRNDPDAGTALLEQSVQMAITLGMHLKGFAKQHSRGDAVLEESWRRTWWQILIADAHIAGSAHTFSFHTSGVDMTADLPCEEHEYEACTIPTPKTLQQYDVREFSPDEGVEFSSFAELIGLTRGLYLALSCDGEPAPNKYLSICTNIDISMTGWYSLLPPSKQCVLRSDESLDEMMFMAQFIMHTCTVEFHRRLSTLRASPIEHISRCAPLAPSERPQQRSRPEPNVHTIKCVRAIRKIDELLILPTNVTTHSPFLICMIANVTIAKISACRLVLRGKNLAQHRERIRLTLGTLKSLSQHWMLGKQTYEEIGTIARDSLLSSSRSSPSTTSSALPLLDYAHSIEPLTSVSQTAATNFDAYLDNEIPFEDFDTLQESILTM